MTDDAAALRAEAAKSRQDAVDSWERSDTDGFLSQWASGITARLKDEQASIAENGGVATFARRVLQTVAGETVADARVVNTRYGTKWRSDELDVWLPYWPQRESTLPRKGFREVEEEEEAPARAKVEAHGTGLSGAASAYIRVYRPDRPKSEGWRCTGYHNIHPEAS